MQQRAQMDFLHLPKHLQRHDAVGQTHKSFERTSSNSNIKLSSRALALVGHTKAKCLSARWLLYNHAHAQARCRRTALHAQQAAQKLHKPKLNPLRVTTRLANSMRVTTRLANFMRVTTRLANSMRVSTRLANSIFSPQDRPITFLSSFNLHHQSSIVEIVRNFSSSGTCGINNIS